MLEIVARGLAKHASSPRLEPHRTAWIRVAQEVHSYWLELSSLPGGRR